MQVAGGRWQVGGGGHTHPSRILLHAEKVKQRVVHGRHLLLGCIGQVKGLLYAIRAHVELG